MSWLLYLYLLASFKFVCRAYVFIWPTDAGIYETSCLPIRGKEFCFHRGDRNVPVLGTNYNGVPEDWYKVEMVDENNFKICLKHGRKWLDLSDHTRNALVLNLGAWNCMSGNRNMGNYLKELVQVATVFRNPVIFSDETVRLATERTLYIQGLWLQDATRIVIQFNVPLVQDVDYMIVDKFPLKYSNVTLKLLPNKVWAQYPTPLIVSAVDTGAGLFPINPGVTVAFIDAFSDVKKPKISITASNSLMYRNASSLELRGSGFVGVARSFIFSSGLKLGEDYSVGTVYSTHVTLTLLPGKTWCGLLCVYPYTLRVMGVNTKHPKSFSRLINEEFITVATIVDFPVVQPVSYYMYKVGQFSTIRVSGTGLTSIKGAVHVKLSRPLVEGIDYSLNVTSPTALELTPLPGKSWGPVGDIYITAVTAVDPNQVNGWFSVPATQQYPRSPDGVGAYTASIIYGTEIGVTFDSFAAIASRYNKDEVIINVPLVKGIGKDRNISYVFNMPLAYLTDYTVMDFYGERIRIKAGILSFGPLIILQVVYNDVAYNVNGTNGLHIADIYNYPQVYESYNEIYNSQTKILQIKGWGFTSQTRIDIGFRNFTVVSVTPNTIFVQLNVDSFWEYPDSKCFTTNRFMTKSKAIDKMHCSMWMSSINTGGGYVKTRVVVANIIRDDPKLVCNDECTFANNGICEEVSSIFESRDKELCSNGTDCSDCGGVDHVNITYVPIDKFGQLVIVPISVSAEQTSTLNMLLRGSETPSLNAISYTTATVIICAIILFSCIIKYYCSVLGQGGSYKLN